MVEQLGRSQSFLVYAAFCAAAVFFVQKYVPETRGKTLEEIENSLRVAATTTSSSSSTSDGAQPDVGASSGGASLKSGLLDSNAP